MIRIAVTEKEFRKAQTVFDTASANGLECISAPRDEAALARRIIDTGATHAIVGVDAYTGLLYDALARGGVIARFGVGHEGIDTALATARGLLCTNTPGALDDSVAEHCISLMLAAARHTTVLASQVRKGQWATRVGCELKGKTLAVIGCGRIGCRVAEIATLGLGMRVIGNEIRDVDTEALCQHHGFASILSDFGAAVKDADFVTLHIPATPATHHFMDAQRLARLSPDTWLINTARGAVLCENDLYDALHDGRLGGAALDVFEVEPYVPQSATKDLRTLSDCVMTPHLGSSTHEACERIAARALGNIELAIAGQYDAMDLLNPEALS